jgi:DNA-3-methyladenine glycosylase II
MTRQRVRSPDEDLRRADPVLGAVIDAVVREGGIRPTLPPHPALSNDPKMPTDCYGVLIRGIAGQNISAFASRAISLRSLAEHILSGELELDRLHDLCPRSRGPRTWSASRSRGARTGHWRASTCGA